MNSPKVRMLAAIAAILLIVVLPVLAACGKTAEKKEKVVKFGVLVDMTGPQSVFGKTYQVVLGDVLYLYNTTIGAKKGVKMDAEIFDFRFEPTLGAQGARKFIVEDKYPVIGGWGSQMTPTLKPILEEFKVPSVDAGTLEPGGVWPPGWFYTAVNGYNDAGKLALKYYKEQMYKGTGRPRLALMYVDSSYGRGTLKAVRTFAEAQGIDIVADIPLPGVVTDATPELTRIRDAKTDFIWMVHTTPNYAVVFKDQARLGMKVPIFAVGPAIHKTLLDLAAGTAEGLLYGGTYFLDWWDQADPNYKKVLDTIMDNHFKNHPELGGKVEDALAPTLNVYMWGWYWYSIIAKALDSAGDKVGFDKITPAAVKYALDNNIKNFDGFIPGLKPLISYSPDDHRGTKELRLTTIRNNQFAPATDWIPVPPKSDAEKRGEY